MSVSAPRRMNVPQPSNGRPLPSTLEALKSWRTTLDALAPKKIAGKEASSDGARKALVSSLSGADKTASKSKNLSWIPPQGAMLAKLPGGAQFWVEWTRVAGQGNGWKIEGFVYIYANGKKQPSSKMAFDANNSLITKDGRLIVTLPNSRTQIQGTRKVNETASAKIYYQFYSLYHRIKSGRAEKNRLVLDKKKSDVTLASADLFLFLQKHKKRVEAKSSLGSWLRKNLAQLMKAKDLGKLVPKSVRLAVEASGLDMKLFGLKPTPVRGRKLAAGLQVILDGINLANFDLERLLLRRLRDAFGTRPGITNDEFLRLQRRLAAELQINDQNRHPFNLILGNLYNNLVQPGFLGDAGMDWAARRDLRNLLWEMMQAAVDGVNLDGFREEMQQLIEGEVGRGERADLIVDAIFNLNMFRPNGLVQNLNRALADFLNDNRERIAGDFNDGTVGAAYYLAGWRGGSN